MIFFTFLSAFLLSGIAAYYSVIGLAAIFPGSFWPVVIMGSSLEFAKLVTASWLYRNWAKSNTLLKTYLTLAVLVLMLITSMGIFGFLSKAHMEHSADVGPLAEKVALYNEKIKTEKDNIDASRKELKQYDEIVDQTMGRSTDEKGADKAQAIRRSQQKDRNRILQEISHSQASIAKLSEERAPLSSLLKKEEADVGPIKYIAALVYSESIDEGVIDKAVRLVIMLIILVFDPLAVLLLIAGNITMKEKYDIVEVDSIQADAPQEPIAWPVVDKDTYLFRQPPDEEVVVETPAEEIQATEAPAELVEQEPIVAPAERTTQVDSGVLPISEIRVGSMSEVTPETTIKKVIDNHRPGFHTEEHVEVPADTKPSKILEPKYDYDSPYSFREKE